MAKQKDVFGFDEFEKAFNKIKDRYESSSDALLHAMATQAGKRMRQVAPRGVDSKSPGTLKKSYRVKKPKKYKGGKVKVSRVQNAAPHSHLVEYGHEVYTSKKKVGRASRYNAIGRRIKGITKHGKVEGQYLFDKVWKEYKSRFPKETQKLLEKITKDLEV